jgi:hypothetical protein
MALIAMVSAKGSPGVSTAALACTLAWDSRVVLAECDPAGGSVLTGYLAKLEISPIGLLPVAAAALRNELSDVFARQLVDLDNRRRGHRLVLPGITDPVQAGTIRPTWEALAGFFVDLEHAEPGFDVLADCGRLNTSAPPLPLLARADLVLLVTRTTGLRDLVPTAATADRLRRELTQSGRGPGSLALVLIGDGPYPRSEVEQRLQLPVLAELPVDPLTAEFLNGGSSRRGSQHLLRAAASAESRIREAITARRVHLAALPPAREVHSVR